MKKVLLISEFFYPHWTGISVSFLQFAKQLISLGNTVKVLTVKHDPSLSDSEVYEGVEILRSEYQLKISRTFYSFRILFDCATLLKNFDTVVINSPNSNVLFLTIVCKLFGKKTTIWHQGDLVMPQHSGNKITNWLMMKIFDVLTISAFALSDTIATFTSDYAKYSRVMKHFPQKTKIYIPPIDISYKGLDKKTEIFTKISYLKRKHLLVGFAGRFVEEKGFDILLRAIPLVLAKVPSAHFVFAGETQINYETTFQQNQSLLETVDKHLMMCGLLNRDELFDFYKKMDVFVLASRTDCFNLTQAEASLLGTPLVVTSIPGARMLVKETGYGELAQASSPESLANAIIKVLKNPNKYRQNYDKINQFYAKYSTPPLA